MEALSPAQAAPIQAAPGGSEMRDTLGRVPAHSALPGFLKETARRRSGVMQA